MPQSATAQRPTPDAAGQQRGRPGESRAARWFGESTEGWLTWIALGSVAVFLVWAAITFHDIALAIYTSSDNASAPVIAQLFGNRGSGDVTLGYYPWLEPLFALRATHWIPWHRQLWELQPFLYYGAVLALAGWAVGRTVSRRAGLLVALAMAAPAPLVVAHVGAPNMRGLTLFHIVLLGAFLVTAPELSRWSLRGQALWGVALAVTLAAGASSDPLVLIAGVGPLLVAAGAGWRLGLISRRSAGVVAAAGVLGAVGGRALERLAEHSGIGYWQVHFGVASPDQILDNVRLLLEDVALFAHGRLSDSAAGISAVEHPVAIAAMVLVPVLLCLIVLSGRSVLTDAHRSAAQRLLAIYWGAVVLAAGAAFIGSTAPVNVSAVRYMLMLWPALLTLAAIVWRRRALPWLAGVAILAAVLGCVDLARDRYSIDSRLPAEARGIERFVARNGLDHGYAGYWNSASITYLSDFETRVYPVIDCNNGARCQFPFHTIDTWYRPMAGTRTFYVSEANGSPPAVGPPPRSWGHPFARARVGQLTVFAYDHDLAEHLGPPPASSSDR